MKVKDLIIELLDHPIDADVELCYPIVKEGESVLHFQEYNISDVRPDEGKVVLVTRGPDKKIET